MAHFAGAAGAARPWRSSRLIDCGAGDELETLGAGADKGKEKALSFCHRGGDWSRDESAKTNEACLASTFCSAVIVEDAAESLAHTIQVTKGCWREASREVLGFELDADATVWDYDGRYEDGDGGAMWDTIMALLAETERQSDGEPRRKH